MRRVLLDACVPHRLRTELTDFDVVTAHFAGLDQLPDGALLDAIDGQFDVLVTLDRSLLSQQRISGRQIAVVVLRLSEQTPKATRASLPRLLEAIARVEAGTSMVVRE